MKIGASRRNLYALGGLVLIGGYLFYDNVLSGPSASPEPSRPARSAQSSTSRAPAAAAEAPDSPSVARRPNVRNSEEFRPSLKRLKRQEERVDPMTIDPTLRLDLLAKVQAVNMEGGARNLFAVGAPPLPPEPIVKPGGPGQQARVVGPELPPPPPQPPTAAPPPPPIKLKYYG